MRAPYFYGQSYGSWLEALLAVPLRSAGLALRHALPIAGTVFSLLPALLLAGVAWRRRARLAAAAILAGYLLLSTEAVAAYAMPRGLAPGIALAALAVAVAVAWAPGALAMLAFGCIATVAASFNESSLLLSAPAAAYFALRHWRSSRMWLSLVVGVELGLVFHVLARRFYEDHPAYEVHYRWPLAIESDHLRENSARLHDYFTAFSFDFLRSPAVPFVVAALVGVVLIARRGLPGLAAFVAAVVAGIATLATAKAADGSPSVFFPYFRFFFVVPAVVAFFTVEASSGRPLRRWLSRTAALAFLAVGMAGFAARGANVESEVRRLTAGNTEGRYQAPTITDWALEDCRQIGQLARAHDARLVVYLKDRVEPYLCGAELYGDVQTLFPSYERRTWDLQRESVQPRTRMMISGGGPEFCDNAAWAATSCQHVNQRLDLAVLEFPSQPAVPLLRRLGVTVGEF